MLIIDSYKRLTLILFIFVLFLAACSPNAASEDGEKNLIVATTGEANSLDPHNTTDTVSKEIYSVVTETLVMLDENGDIAPLLAKSWEQSDDGKSWTFQLEDGVLFHDGTEFNAEAVKASFERVTNKENKLARYPLLGPYLDKITTNGDHEVTFHLNSPVGPFLNILAFPSGNNIISPKSIEMGEEAIKNKPIGTGPYKIKHWLPGSDTVFEANLDYWGDAPQVDLITFKSVPENASRVIMLETGEADIITDVPHSDTDRLNDNDGIKLETVPLNRTVYVGINNSVAPFDNELVRQALNYAVDKDALTNDLYEGRVIESTAAVSSLDPMYANAGSYPYDIEKAKKILKEAGVEEGMKLRLVAAANLTRDHKAGEYVQSSLQQLGFDVELQVLELNNYLDTLDDPSKYELFLRGGSSQTNDANELLQTTLFSTSDFNYAGYSNPKVDELLEEGAINSIVEERKNIYAEALGIIKEEAPWIFLYQDVVYHGVAKNVGGFIIPPNNTINYTKVSK